MKEKELFRLLFPFLRLFTFFHVFVLLLRSFDFVNETISWFHFTLTKHCCTVFCHMIFSLFEQCSRRCVQWFFRYHLKNNSKRNSLSINSISITFFHSIHSFDFRVKKIILILFDFANEIIFSVIFNFKINKQNKKPINNERMEKQESCDWVQ